MASSIFDDRGELAWKRCALFLWCVWLCLLSGVGLAMAQQAGTEDEHLDLTEFPIDALVSMQVVTATRTGQGLFETPAAVHVITAEDIRRSGATTIPDLLRTVPGVNVSQINANSWAVSVRGFNQRFASKLLVMQDGMTIYSPTFSGVYWGTRDTLLEDVERIEIVRGPGGALWGANAVNGVINIITKNAEDTQGGLVVAGGGTEEGLGAIRYGGKPSDALAYRLWAKGTYTDASVRDNGDRANDKWETVRGGMRADITPSEDDAITITADGFRGHMGQTTVASSPYAPRNLTPTDYDAPYWGANALARWEHTFSEDMDLALQVYFDAFTLTHQFDGKLFSPDVDLTETTYTLDIDSQYRFPLGSRQEILFGLGYRSIWHSFMSDPANIGDVTPDRAHMSIYSGFLQNTISLSPDILALILGVKLEHNDFTGFEIQPSARLLWTPTPEHTVWAAVSRAVRTPFRVEHDATSLLEPAESLSKSPVPLQAAFQGSEEFVSEDLLALELGYRIKPTETVSVDLAGFINMYDDLRTFDPSGVLVDPIVTTAFIRSSNRGNALAYGFEATAQWDPVEWLRLDAVYSVYHLSIVEESLADLGVFGEPGFITETEQTRHQASLRTMVDLPYDLELDVTGRLVGVTGVDSQGSYGELDARLGWSPWEDVELSLVGRNLLHDRHNEFTENVLLRGDTQVQRSIFAKMTWRF